MNKITNIVFDFGGVLIDWNPRYAYKEYFNDDQKMEYFLTHICTLQWNSNHDRGMSFAQNAAQLQAVYPEWAEAIGQFYNLWPKMIGGAIEDGVALLYELKAAGYRLWGLTNWSAQTLPQVLREYDFFNGLEGIVVSGAEQVIKPNPEIYRILLERYQLDPAACVFIDDAPQNVQGALDVGMHAVHFTTGAAARHALKELGIALP